MEMNGKASLKARTVKDIYITDEATNYVQIAADGAFSFGNFIRSGDNVYHYNKMFRSMYELLVYMLKIGKCGTVENVILMGLPEFQREGYSLFNFSICVDGK